MLNFKTIAFMVVLFLFSLFMVSCGGGSSSGGGGSGSGSNSCPAGQVGIPPDCQNVTMNRVSGSLLTKYAVENNSALVYNNENFLEDRGVPRNEDYSYYTIRHPDTPNYELYYVRIQYPTRTTPIHFLDYDDSEYDLEGDGDLIRGSESYISYSSLGDLNVGGPDFERTPSGIFTYSGVNLLRYTGTEFSGTPAENGRDYNPNIDFQDGTFSLVADFSRQTGTITGSAVQRHFSPPGASSTISGKITLNNQTGEFNTPDGEFLMVTLNEPEGVSLPKTSGVRMINAKIYGQFSGRPINPDTNQLYTNGSHGVYGIYYDASNEEPVIYGAIAGSRQ